MYFSEVDIHGERAYYLSLFIFFLSFFPMFSLFCVCVYVSGSACMAPTLEGSHAFPAVIPALPARSLVHYLLVSSFCVVFVLVFQSHFSQTLYG